VRDADTGPPNPYAPPVAAVADLVDGDPSVETPFFAVSLRKLSIMSVCTFGLYEFFWFFSHWAIIRRRDRRVVPLARAFFAVLFCYPLMSHVRKFGPEQAGLAPARLYAGLCTTGWILFTLTQRLPHPYWLLTFVAFVFLLPVQRRVNEINAAVAPGHYPNDRFTPLNWIGIVLGGSLLVLMTLDLFLPE